MNSLDTRSIISLPVSADGVTRSGSPESPTPSESLPALAHASHSAQPGSAKAQKTSATSGPSSKTLSPSSRLQSRLESRLRARTDVNGSPEYVLTWKHWDMRSGPPICALRASGRRTSDSAFTGWPPACANDSTGTQKRTGRQGGESLKQAAMKVGWSTPNTPSGGRSMSPEKMDATGRTVDGKKHTASLEHAAKFAGWPTPMAGNAGTEDYNPAGNTDSSRKTVEPVGWNTPRATDGSNGGPNQAGGALPADAEKAGWHTPVVRDARNSHGDGSNPRDLPRQIGLTATGTNAEMVKREGFRLNPSFSRWLMGYPAAWDSCGVTAMQSCRKSPRRSSRQLTKA